MPSNGEYGLGYTLFFVAKTLEIEILELVLDGCKPDQLSNLNVNGFFGLNYIVLFAVQNERRDILDMIFKKIPQSLEIQKNGSSCVTLAFRHAGKDLKKHLEDTYPESLQQ